jgi:hypothetical protein
MWLAYLAGLVTLPLMGLAVTVIANISVDREQRRVRETIRRISRCA